MAMETVGSSGTYYYQKTWVNGTCKSEYIGHGDIAKFFVLEQRHKNLKAKFWQAEKKEALTIDKEIYQQGVEVTATVARVLIACGYHQHKRMWRLKKVAKKAIAKKTEKVGTCIRHDLIVDLIGFASQVYDDDPEVRSANFDANVSAWVKLKDDLDYEESSAVEKLLIDQVILCQVRVHWLEAAGLQKLKEGVTLSQGDFYARREAIAHHRYIRSIEALARVRKLASRTPEILQVNIAQKQVTQVSG